MDNLFLREWGEGSLVNCRILSSIPSLYLLNVGSISYPALVDVSAEERHSFSLDANKNNNQWSHISTPSPVSLHQMNLFPGVYSAELKK